MRIKTIGKQVFKIALSNMDSWMRSTRVIAMAVCVIFYCIMQVVVDSPGVWVMDFHFDLTLQEKLLSKLYNGFYSMGSLLFLIMVSEIPRRINYQKYLFIRSTKNRWMAGQCLYCAMMVILMILLLIITYLLFALPSSTASNAYTDTQYILNGAYEQEDAYISFFIRNSFSPWQACLFACIPMFLFWYTMVLIILLFSMLKLPLLGPSLFGFLLLAQSTLLVECLPPQMVLPTEFASLGAILAEHSGMESKRLISVFVGYFIMDALLIFLLFRLSHKADLCLFDE